MTPNQAIAWTVTLLEHFFGMETCWYCRVIPEFPDPHSDKAGHCDDERKRITLAGRYLNRALQTIAHEVAHALTPNDWSHGPEFQAAFAHVTMASNRLAHISRRIA